MASGSACHAPSTGFVLPDGWERVIEVRDDGKLVEFFINDHGKRFYDKEHLIRHVNKSKAKAASVYASGESSGKRNEAEDNREKECANALLDLYAESLGTVVGAMALLKISSHKPTPTVRIRTARKPAVGLASRLYFRKTNSKALGSSPLGRKAA